MQARPAGIMHVTTAYLLPINFIRTNERMQAGISDRPKKQNVTYMLVPKLAEFKVSP